MHKELPAYCCMCRAWNHKCWVMQASDLERLLSMYARWQQRIFNHGTFDIFLEALEKIGSTNQLKVPCALPCSRCYWQLHSQRLCPAAAARGLQHWPIGVALLLLTPPSPDCLHNWLVVQVQHCCCGALAGQAALKRCVFWPSCS